jgi:5-methylcytosine-specific restriction endonuclease McrA
MAYRQYRRKRKKEKPVGKLTDKELAAEIAAADIRIREWLDLSQRIRRQQAQRQECVNQIEPKIRVLQNKVSALTSAPNARQCRFLAVVTGSPYRREIREQLNGIQELINNLKRSIPADRCTETGFSYYSFSVALERLETSLRGSQALRAKFEGEQARRLQEIERQRADIEKKRKTEELRREQARERRRAVAEKQKEKDARIRHKLEDARAAAAENSKEARRQAANIRRKLEHLGDCPYCGVMLNGGGHADHIYPLSRGGHSNLRNMVVVCEACNQKKAGMTLREFIKKYGLDRDSIERRLEELGKQF